MAQEKDKLLPSDAKMNMSHSTTYEFSPTSQSADQKAVWETSSPQIVMPEYIKRDGLSKTQVAAYAVGHFCNDLCAAAWFTYVLFFVKEVVKLDSVVAGFVMLSGQIADGLTTPVVGFFSDKSDTRCGKRTPWYIFGTLLVLPTFLGIFIQPSFENENTKVAYYVILPAVFNVGM